MEQLPEDIKLLIVKYAGNQVRLVSNDFNKAVKRNAKFVVRKAVRMFVRKSKDAKKHVEIFKRNALRISVSSFPDKKNIRAFLISSEIETVKNKFNTLYSIPLPDNYDDVDRDLSSKVARLLMFGIDPDTTLMDYTPGTLIASVKFGVTMYKQMMKGMSTLEILNCLSNDAINSIFKEQM